MIDRKAAYLGRNRSILPMRTTLLSVLLFSSSFASAQVIPGETPGDLGWYPVGSDTVIIVRASDGNAWTQKNLGSTAVAAAPNDPNAFGNLYQWGRWTDGHQIRTSAMAQASTLSSNDPTGIGMGSPFFFIGTNPADWWSTGATADSWMGSTANATNGIDPCASLGPGWQLPTREDWENILGTEAITDLATAFDSHLKLTAAGSRDGQTGTVINAGQFGNYWSRTANGLYAKDLTIGETFVNADDDAYRSYGMSVRCLHRNLHTGISDQAENNDLRIFPNPSSGPIRISSSALIEKIEVFDMLSRSIAFDPIGRASSSIDLNTLPEGKYFIRITTRTGTSTRSVVILR